MATPRTRLLLVDDHPFLRLGLVTLFESEPRFQIAGQAGTGAEALALARATRPDIAIVDLRLPDAHGAEICRDMRSELPGLRVIVLTSYSDQEAVIMSLLAGAEGYVLKRSDPERLIEAVETVERGESLLDPAVTGTVLVKLRELISSEAYGPLADLTDAERAILPMVVGGKTNRQIAELRGVKPSTVKDQVSGILGKFQLQRRGDARWGCRSEALREE
jgi:DNA-binding NarL/FixJ family response regulator